MSDCQILERIDPELLENGRIELSKTIINYYYNNDHYFVYENSEYGYDGCFISNFNCNKCKFKIEVIFWNVDDFHIKFYKDFPAFDDYKTLSLNYFGISRIFNDDKVVDLISCKEFIIKKLLE